MYKGIHTDVLHATLDALTGQLNRQEITLAEFEQAVAPIVVELQTRTEMAQEAIRRQVIELRTALAEQTEQHKRERAEHLHESDMFEAFLLALGLEGEFEAFEAAWPKNILD